MPGVGWAAYQGESEAFFVEQTKLEAKSQERIKEAASRGVDLFEGHEEDVVTAGDCLYGVSRGANDRAEAAATVAASQGVQSTAAAPAKKAPRANGTTVVKKKKTLRDYNNNTFDRHRTEVGLANRALQAKKAAEKAEAEKPFVHSAYAANIRKAILSGDIDALPDSHKGIPAEPTDPSKQTQPLDIDGGGRVAKAGAYDVDTDALDQEMSALVNGAVEAAAEKKAAAEVTKAKKSTKGGPAWALTAEEADELELAEEEELLAFADNLDFDSYVETIDEQDLNEAKAALDALVAAAAVEGGDFDDEAAAADGSAEHLARVDAWKAKFADAVNRVRECEDKINARKVAIRTARAAVHVAGTEGSASAFTVADGGVASAKEKAADAEAKKLLESFPDLAKVHSARSLKGVLERTAKPPTPLHPSLEGDAATTMLATVEE